MVKLVSGGSVINVAYLKSLTSLVYAQTKCSEIYLEIGAYALKAPRNLSISDSEKQTANIHMLHSEILSAQHVMLFRTFSPRLEDNDIYIEM